MTIEDIRPQYYRECGEIGRAILGGLIPDDWLDLECRDVIRMTGNDFSLGNALKYLWRLGGKYDDHGDMLKARFYLLEHREACRNYISRRWWNSRDAIDTVLDRLESHL